MMFNFQALPQLGDAKSILDIASDLADPSSGISSITIETAWLPPLSSEAPLAGEPSWLLQQLKPKVTVAFASGQTIVRAPYGEPGPSKWPWLAAGLVALLGVAGYVAWRKLR